MQLPIFLEAAPLDRSANTNLLLNTLLTELRPIFRDETLPHMREVLSGYFALADVKGNAPQSDASSDSIVHQTLPTKPQLQQVEQTRASYLTWIVPGLVGAVALLFSGTIRLIDFQREANEPKLADDDDLAMDAIRSKRVDNGLPIGSPTSNSTKGVDVLKKRSDIAGDSFAKEEVRPIQNQSITRNSSLRLELDGKTEGTDGEVMSDTKTRNNETSELNISTLGNRFSGYSLIGTASSWSGTSTPVYVSDVNRDSNKITSLVKKRMNAVTNDLQTHKFRVDCNAKTFQVFASMPVSIDSRDYGAGKLIYNQFC